MENVIKTIKKEVKKLNKPQKIALVMTIIGAIILAISIILFVGTGYFQTVAVIAVMLTGLPYTFYKYWEYRKIRSIERYLPDYLRDVSEAIESGLTLNQALMSSTKGSYGTLSTEMERTASQISWGVSFEDAMKKFIERNPSYLTKKAIMVIIESQRSGGDIAKALRTVATDIKSVGRMKKQRESKLKVYTYS
ncbi:MAG: type II secretion system F family protein, partial [archaeon]